MMAVIRIVYRCNLLSKFCTEPASAMSYRQSVKLKSLPQMMTHRNSACQRVTPMTTPARVHSKIIRSLVLGVAVSAPVESVSNDGDIFRVGVRCPYCAGTHQHRLDETHRELERTAHCSSNSGIKRYVIELD